MQEKLFDSEAKVMEILWEKGTLSAKEISLIASESIGWNKNTTYTIIKKLEAKGFIRRDEPGFMCTPLVSREEIQKNEASTLLNNLLLDFQYEHRRILHGTDRSCIKKDQTDTSQGVSLPLADPFLQDDDPLGLE